MWGGVDHWEFRKPWNCWDPFFGSISVSLSLSGLFLPLALEFISHSLVQTFRGPGYIVGMSDSSQNLHLLRNMSPKTPLEDRGVERF